MGRQVNFFLHSDDQADFDKLLKSFGELVLIPYYHYDNVVSTVSDTILIDPRKDGTRIYLVRPENLQDIKLKHIEKFNYWLVDETSLPVLHYDRCVTKDNEILSGRLYFQPQFVSNGNWCNKSDIFVNWADHIIKTVRRKLKKHQLKMGDYLISELLGEKTKMWAEQNNAVLKPGGGTLMARK